MLEDQPHSLSKNSRDEGTENTGRKDLKNSDINNCITVFDA
jgi:hypothetical protein